MRLAGRPRGVTARRIGRGERDDVLRFLRRSPRDDLLLLDFAASAGRPAGPGEAAVELIGAWCGDRLRGVASLRPSLVLASRADPKAIEALAPVLARLDAGLLKSPVGVADPLWRSLRRHGLRALLDRTETAYAVDGTAACLTDASPDLCVRPAVARDLPDLVQAARASLREERRPDPAVEDPQGFRRWVAARIPRARVVERDGRVVFTGYADVQRPEGWLIQGVYTAPAARRQGVAAAGVSALCREAFRAGAQHVQLAVVDGNLAGERLYAHLGFEPFARLRTVLFA